MTISAAFCFNLDNQLHFCKLSSDMVAYGCQPATSVDPHCGIVAYQHCDLDSRQTSCILTCNIASNV